MRDLSARTTKKKRSRMWICDCVHARRAMRVKGEK